MPLVEQYPNWVSLDPVDNTAPLVKSFYEHSAAWQKRPMQSFFAECAWYKFPYCCHVPWYQDLNTEEIIGKEQSDLYEQAKPLFDHIATQLGNEYLMWGAELNSVPAGSTVKPHCDRHFYSDYTTRVHVVLKTNDDVEFVFENQTKNFKEGECFIFNNKLTHGIINNGITARLHLVVDFVPRSIFLYTERSIGVFGGHEGTMHILNYIRPSNPIYGNYIKQVDGHSEKYPYLTSKYVR